MTELFTKYLKDVFTEEEKRIFREKPEVYNALRVESEDFLNSGHYITIEGSKLQNSVRSAFEKRMKAALKDNPEIAETLIVSQGQTVMGDKQLMSPRISPTIR